MHATTESTSSMPSSTRTDAQCCAISIEYRVSKLSLPLFGGGVPVYAHTEDNTRPQYSLLVTPREGDGTKTGRRSGTGSVMSQVRTRVVFPENRLPCTMTTRAELDSIENKRSRNNGSVFGTDRCPPRYWAPDIATDQRSSRTIQALDRDNPTSVTLSAPREFRSATDITGFLASVDSPPPSTRARRLSARILVLYVLYPHPRADARPRPRSPLPACMRGRD